MTDPTPIDRAVEALEQSTAHVAGRAFGVPEEAYENHAEAVAHAAFDSIDTNELADVLVRDLTYSTGLDSESNDSIARHQAQAVIEWLTTGEKLGGPERQLGTTRLERKHQ